jgi:hypothetical protein
MGEGKVQLTRIHVESLNGNDEKKEMAWVVGTGLGRRVGLMRMLLVEPHQRGQIWERFRR